MDDVAVSVIVPTRNRAHFLDACLDTLLTQRCHVSYEILVVDNASDDPTPQVLEGRARRDPRVVVAQEPTLGRSRALNVGIRRARGCLLLFTDDDVLVDPDWIASYVEFFAARPGEMVIAGGPILPTPDDGGGWPAWVGTQGLRDLPGSLDWGEEQSLQPPRYFWGANIAIPLPVLEHVGLWNESLGHRGDMRGTYEDLEYQDRVRSTGGAVWFIPRCIVRHRIPRRDVTPRRVLRGARIRGANDYWHSGHGEQVRRQNPARVAAKLAAHASGAIAWTALFRLDPRPQWYNRARASIRGTGWMTEELTHRWRPQWSRERLTNRPRLDPRTLVLRRTTSLTSRLAERLVPDQPS